MIIVGEGGGMRLGTLHRRLEKGEICGTIVLQICKTEKILTVTMHISAKTAFIR